MRREAFWRRGKAEKVLIKIREEEEEKKEEEEEKKEEEEE